MKIRAEIFNGINMDNNLYKYKYYECFKNPNTAEWGVLNELSSTVRGVLLRNGDVYAWSGEIMHEKAETLFGIPNGIHFQTYSKNSFNMYLIPETDLDYICEAFKNTVSLYNYFNNNAKIIEINDNYYKAEKNEVYKNLHYISDIIKYDKELVTSNKQAAIFNGANVNGEYMECFKNPNLKEWESIMTIDMARGILQDNGDLYIWLSDISHDDAVGKFNIPSGIHIQAYNKTVIGIFLLPETNFEYMYKAFTNTTSLYVYMDKNSRVLELNTNYYKAEHDNRYYRIKNINDIIELYNSTPSLAKLNKQKRLIKAEIADGRYYKDVYYECFHNPTKKDWTDLMKTSLNARGILLNSGELYIWNADLLHQNAIGLFQLPDGLHIEIYDGGNAIGIYPIVGTDLDYMYDAFTNCASLYSYVNKNFDIYFIDTDMYGAKDDSRYDNIKSVNDLIIAAKEARIEANIKMYSKENNMKRLIKKSEQIGSDIQVSDNVYQIYKNPTSQEYSATKRNGKIKGFAFDNGDIYIYPYSEKEYGYNFGPEQIHGAGVPDGGIGFSMPNFGYIILESSGKADMNYIYKIFKNGNSIWNYLGNAAESTLEVIIPWSGSQPNDNYSNFFTPQDLIDYYEQSM